MHPSNNFYLVDGQPSTVSQFVEYRYLTQRHIMSNIALNKKTGELYNLVLPEQTLLVLIMPSNFISLGLKHGYFRFENNIIVRVYSKYILSSNSDRNDVDSGEITFFDASNLKIRRIIEQFFNKLGIHKIVSNDDNQIYGYDKYITLVVGKVTNVIMPS